MSDQVSLVSDLKQSRNLIRKQKYSEAAELLRKLLEQNGSHEDALELLGMALFYSKQLEAARDAFQQLTKVNPSHAQGWVNLGAVLNRLGEFRKAVEALRRALQKDRKCAEAYYNMGIAQRGQGMNTMAISAYKEAIKLKPDLIEAHLNLGNIYVDMKNMGLALQCFQTAVRLDPSSKKAKSSLEKAQMNQKTLRREVSPFGRLVDVNSLDKQLEVSGPRVLSAAERVTERELAQEVTRKVRAATKELVPLLEDALHGHLHRLERIVLQSDSRLASSDHLQQFSQLLSDICRLRSIVGEGLSELRQQIS